MKKSLLVSLSVLSASAWSFAALGGSAFATARHSSSVTTINWAASPISNVGIRKSLIQLFEKTHPTIHVILTSQPTNTDTNRASLATEISGGSATPDVFMGDVVWPGQFANAGLALPLNKYLPKSYFSTFAPGLVNGATYKGQVYGAPFFMDAGFLYYRKDLLAKAHLPVPKTWEQLANDSKVLLNKHLVKYGFVWEGASYEGLTCDWMEYLTDAGGQVFNASGKPVMNSAAAIKALTFMRSLITSGISPKSVTTFQEPQAMNVFNQGDAAFLRNWDYAWSNSQTKGTNVVGKVGVVPMPTFAGHPSPGYGTIGGWNLYINPHSKHIQADLTFIKWMTSVPAQTVLASKYSEIPTNNQVQHDPAIRKLNPVLAIVGSEHLVPRPSQSPNYPKVSSAIYQNVNAALSGQVSVKTALNNANNQLASASSSSSL